MIASRGAVWAMHATMPAERAEEVSELVPSPVEWWRLGLVLFVCDGYPSLVDETMALTSCR